MALGPDVWELVKFLREIDERGLAAVEAAAEMLNLTEAQVRVALHYYSAHTEEVNAEIEQADEASRTARAAWEAEQRLLA